MSRASGRRVLPGSAKGLCGACPSGSGLLSSDTGVRNFEAVGAHLGSPFPGCALPFGVTVRRAAAKGTDAEKYSDYARACERQARQARTRELRDMVLQPSRVWMSAALEQDVRPSLCSWSRRVLVAAIATARELKNST